MSGTEPSASLSPGGGLLATLRTFPRPFWILMAGVFINRFGTFVIPFLTLYLRDLGFPARAAGFALAAYGAGHLLASLVGGQLADQLGRRRTLAFSMLSTAVAMLALGQVRAFPWILAMAMLTGFTAELSRPAAGALLIDLVPAAQRVTAFAVYRLAVNAGFAFGPAVAGVLSGRSYQWLFVGDAVTSLIFGWLAWRGLPEGRRSTRDEARWMEAWQVMIRDRQLLRVVAASLLTGLAFMQLSASFGLQVTSQGHTKSVFGMLLSLNGALIVLVELPLTRFTSRLPVRPTLAVGHLLIGLGFSLVGWAVALPWLVAAVVVFTLGEMLSMPVAAAYVAELAPEHLRGRYLGVYGLSWATALVLGPALGVAVFEANPSALWLGCGFLGVVAAWIIRPSK